MTKFEVVISGISGELPGCFVDELEEKAFTDENMITEMEFGKSSKFSPYAGRTVSPVKCDNSFLGIHQKLAEAINIKTITSLEKAYEALTDAGINPTDLAGTKCGVIVSSTCEDPSYNVQSHSTRYFMLGEAKCMMGNRVSYLLGTTGPSFYMDGGWTSSLQSLQIASSWIASGFTKMAIIGVDSAQSQPLMNYHYEGLKLLNWDGKTKSFSGNADGFSKSTARIFFILQRAEDANKSYGTIVRVNTSTQLNRNHITDRANFSNFMRDMYSDLNVNTNDIAYIEGDGSASIVTDAMELNSYGDIFCTGRKKPLLVGSSKSKFGHALSASGFVSVLNAVIAFKTGYIPPTLHYLCPNPQVPALLDGRMKVVTEKTPLEGDLIGVTSVGVGTIYGHVLLKRNPKSLKITDNTDESLEVPRLFLLTGRDEQLMNDILNKVVNKPIDEYFYAINYKLFKKNIPKHFYRGFSLVSKTNKTTRVENCSDPHHPIWYVVSGMGSQWVGMGKPLLTVPILRKSLKKCHDVLVPLGVDLIHIITTDEMGIFDNILHAFIGIAAIQIALIDLLEALNVKPDGIVGHSTGEICCAYADKCLTLEQAMLAAYYRGKASNDATLIKGMMAAVGKGYAQIKDDLPKDIEVACHNSSTSCTLSGPVDKMTEYVASLKSRGVFAKLVNVADIAYHTKYIQPAAPFLLDYLNKVVPVPKLRSSKWISSSVPEEKWNKESAMYCSAEYMTNNLLNHVLFEEATAHVPKDAICIEIAPHGLLQAIVKKSLSNCVHIPLTKREKSDSTFMIEALGNLFTNGVALDLSKLYPAVKLPAPRETDMMNVLTFDHSGEVVENRNIIKIHAFNLARDVIFEKNQMTEQVFLPYKVMEYFAKIANEVTQGTSSRCFLFNNINMHRELDFDKSKSIRMSTLFQPGSGSFEAFNDDGVIFSGSLLVLLTMPASLVTSACADKQVKLMSVTGNQISSLFGTYGLDFENQFEDIKSISILKEGFSARIKWRGSWDCYLKVLFDLMSVYLSLKMNRGIKLNKIRELVYGPAELSQNHEDVDVYYSEHADYLYAKGVRIMGGQAKPVDNEPRNQVNLQSLQFMPYSKLDSKINFACICLQYFHENRSSDELLLDLIVDDTSKLSRQLVDIMMDKQISNKYKVLLRQRNRVTVVSQEIGLKTCFLVVAENIYEHHINKLLSLNVPFYFIYIGKSIDACHPIAGEQLIPVIKQDNKGHTLVLYTQKYMALENSVFVPMTIDDSGKEVKTDFDNGLNKTYFLVYKYQYISDVINIIQSSTNSVGPNKRFVFLDENSPPFDSNSEFYRQQLMKNLKINIAFGKTWGSIRDVTGESSSSAYSLHKETALNDLRCAAVDLNTLSLNTQKITFPNRYNKVNVIEYSGIKEGKEIFGLGKITHGNNLEIDPILQWEKPKNWTLEEAVTVPYYYCLAYDVLRRSKNNFRPYETILILDGFTPFGQVLITIAIKKGLEVFTTYNTQEQKAFLQKKYPQIKEKYICLCDAYHQALFHKVIMEATNGIGLSIVVDAHEDNTSRIAMGHCMNQKGIYYVFINKDQEYDTKIGLSVMYRYFSLQGYDPSLIFEHSEEKKQTLFNELDIGIKQNIVQPLDKHYISSELSTGQIEDTIVSESQNVIPRKSLLRIKNSQKRSKQTGKLFSQNKSFLIIGGYNDLWLEIISWLCSNGVINIHVVLNTDQINLYNEERLMELRGNHKNAKIEISGTDNISTTQSCKNLIKGITLKDPIDTVFYIKPGFEKELKCVDNALRLLSKDCCLVTVGLEACRVTETRRSEGQKAVSFILNERFAKKKFAQALKIWAEKLIDNGTDISVDLLSQSGLKENPAEIFPLNICEVMDLESNIDRTPSFVEITSKCAPNKFTPELLPVILFPGLKVDKVKKLASQLMFPTYMAQYPREIKSITALASSFSQMLTKQFDMNSLSLIAEGWSGPLVLTVAKLLEEQGKQCLVLLLDAAPHNIQNWNTITHSIIHDYISFNRKDKLITANQLSKWSSKICEEVYKTENCHYNEEEINSCFKILINRLDLVENYSLSCQKLNSPIYLFTSNATREHLQNLEQVCESFQYILIPRTSSSFLENPQLIQSINDLPPVEFKTCARKQNIKEMVAFCDFNNDTILTNF